MAYVLGIDIGSTSTVAAVAHRRGTAWTRPEPVRLVNGSTTVPTVLHLTADGALNVGESVGADGEPDADHTARDFVHRVGDDVPLLVGGEECTPQALVAVLAMWVVERVTAQEYGPPDAIVLSHPAVWGPYRTELLRRALHEIGLGDVTLLPAPICVAESHAEYGFAGDTAAVYCLGGNSFEASLVRRTRRGIFETFGTPRRIEPIGGTDFDEALVERVRGILGREFRNPRDPRLRFTLLGLAPECARAKQELSLTSQADVIVRLPGGPARIPVTRAQLEELIEPAVQATVIALHQVVRAAGLDPEKLDGVLLSGGSARIPLVKELLGTRFSCPAEVEPDPQATVATGAALAAGQIVAPRRQRRSESRRSGTTAEPGSEAVPFADRHLLDDDPDDFGPPPSRPPAEFDPPELPNATRLRLGRRLGRNRERVG